MGAAAVLRGLVLAALLPLSAQAQSDGVIDTQEEYAAAAAGVQAVYDAGDWAVAAGQAGAFADFAETFFGPGHPEPLHYRSLQVFALERLARWDDVLAVADRALQAADAAGPVQPASIPMRIDIGGSLGRALFASGQNERALAVAEGVIAQAETAFGAESPAVVIHRLDRARAAHEIGDAGHMAQAVQDFAFVARVAGASPDASDQGLMAAALREGAEVLRRLDRPRDAADRIAQAVTALEGLHGPDSPEVLSAMLARVDILLELVADNATDASPEGSKNFSETYELAIEVVRRADRVFGEGSPFGAEATAQLGWLFVLDSDSKMDADGVQMGASFVDLGLENMERVLPADDPRLDMWRLAWLSILFRIDQPPPEMALRGVAVARSLISQRAVGLFAFSNALKVAQRSGALTPEQAAEEALSAVQEVQVGKASAMMGIWQRRVGQSSGPASELHRSFTDGLLKRLALEKDLLALLSEPLSTRDKAGQEQVESALTENSAEGDRIAAELAALDPTFGANFAGVTLGLTDLRALLAPDEAAVVVALPDLRVADAAGIIVAVSRDAIAWAPLDRPPGEYLESVSALREAVQLQLGVRAAISLSQDQAAASKRVTFRPDLAARLYADTLGKVETVTAGKAHLYLDLRGAMAMLPPHLMIVTPPAGDDLKGADWLIRHHALTVIPSLTSLRTVALARGQGRAARAYLAFGNPDYGLAVDADPGLATLRGGLAPLPETAQEVQAVALSLGAGDDALRLGGDASEATLKSAGPGQYRVLHFATHGLLSGDGVLDEPALALTAGQGEDGFLRASEILDLPLNADLVVLSACNTALGGTGNDEALSGLAMAFLYAGSKALLVSHWPVESRSAAQLMTETFRLHAADPTIRTAEAQRRAILAMIDTPENPRWSHPAYWAPFVLVGSPD